MTTCNRARQVHASSLLNIFMILFLNKNISGTLHPCPQRVWRRLERDTTYFLWFVISLWFVCLCKLRDYTLQHNNRLRISWILGLKTSMQTYPCARVVISTGLFQTKWKHSLRNENNNSPRYFLWEIRFSDILNELTLTRDVRKV